MHFDNIPFAISGICFIRPYFGRLNFFNKTAILKSVRRGTHPVTKSPFTKIKRKHSYDLQ